MSYKNKGVRGIPTKILKTTIKITRGKDIYLTTIHLDTCQGDKTITKKSGVRDNIPKSITKEQEVLEIPTNILTR